MPRSDEDEKKDTLPPLELKEAISDSAYRSVLVSNFAHGWINMGVRVAVLPLFAAAVFEHGSAAAGLAMAAFAAGNAIALQFSGRLADTIGRKPLIVSGLVFSAIFTGGMGFADSFWPLIIVSALAGMGSGLLNPGQQAVLADVIGNQRSGGKALSTFQMSMDAGQIAGPIVIGALAERYGFTVAFGVCGVLALVAVVAWIFGRETLATSQLRLRRVIKRK